MKDMADYVTESHRRGYKAYLREKELVLLLHAWPAKQVIGYIHPLGDEWVTIWDLARAKMKHPESATLSTSGVFAALKTSDIWFIISEYGVPFAPYRIGERSVDRDLKRSEAIQLGLLKKSDTVKYDSTVKYDNLSYLK